ncbi:trypsin-1 isoform X1 [Ursus maritimus]|uniref:Trypsin-1 isoform X1 n=1 Tax=Ursus maritimus TaxID=29073 RepID=A0A8M1GVS2_URSMA|nr:trypsin-1 isoform X1 [Ursus maritimus]
MSSDREQFHCWAALHLVERRGTRTPRPSAHAHEGLIRVKPPPGHPAMATRLLCCVALCLLGTEFTDAGVIQTPGHKVTKMGQEVTLRCEPISGHRALYWYRQTSGQGPGLLIYFNDQDPLDDSGMPKEWFSAEMTEKTFSTLKIEPTEPKDSATYLCASSVDTANEKLYFASGTKLSVLEDLGKVKPPTVTVFEPSEAETSRTQKATLVCLATGFYPDHVELSWWVNGKEVQNGVSTDPQPYRERPNDNSSNYCLSSRLRVSSVFWHNPRNHFRCQVQFHGLGDDDKWDDPTRPKPVTQNISAEAWGRADCGFTSVSYQQGILSATILYEILLGKATLYAVLVSALVLMAKVKRKGS